MPNKLNEACPFFGACTRSRLQAQALQPGVAIGLAVNSNGKGSLLLVEAAMIPADGGPGGKLYLTGNAGMEMAEAAEAVIGLVRSRARSYEEKMRTSNFHIHLPAIHTPKEGPSAGLAMTAAILSALTGKAISHDIAMTGEVSLTGMVIGVAGIKGKLQAVVDAGIHQVIVPTANAQEANGFREGLTVYAVERIEEALKIIFGEEQILAMGKKEDVEMDRLVILKAAGLEETASDEAVLACITAMRQGLEEKEKLLASAPKKDEVEKLQARAAVLEKQLAAYGEASRGKEEKEKKERVETLIAKGMKEGKIPPAAETEWRAFAEKDLEGTEKLLAVSPPVVPLDRLDAKKNREKGVTISDTQRTLNRMLGVSDEIFTKYGAKAQEEN